MYLKKLGINLGLLALISILGLAFLTGCAKKSVEVGEEGALPTEELVAVEEGPGIAIEEFKRPGIDETGIPGEGIGPAGFGDIISEGRTSDPLHPIYFDYDRFNIRHDMQSVMEENARILLDHPDAKIEIQGNCDDRGTNEYNLALGERRTNSAKAYLVNLGVSPDRIDSVSFGEERPLDPEQNEEAWSKNRRDDFVILK